MDATTQPQDISLEANASIVKQALRELKTSLRRLYKQSVPKILVYGSYARHEAKAVSDVDILLLYPNAIYPGQEIRRVSPALADLNLRYQVLISILPASETEYKQSTTPFWDNVRREGITLDNI